MSIHDPDTVQEGNWWDIYESYSEYLTAIGKWNKSWDKRYAEDDARQRQREKEEWWAGILEIRRARRGFY